ncbi:MAG: glycerol-3-phosphate acyltransferase [Desulfuromonadales bacterium]
MINMFIHPFLILTGYALGCLSTGYYLVRYRLGNDVRCIGSGSSGATNVERLLGKSGFVLTFAGDFGKGVLALALAKWAGSHEPWLALVLIAVVSGHIWPAQLKFKGGKGVATACGGLIVYDPILTLLLGAIFWVLFMVLGERQVAGMFTFLGMPVAALLIGRTVVETTACLLLASLLLWAHRENLAEMWFRAGNRQS